MNIFLSLAFLFFIGSIVGWVLELFFRHFCYSTKSERKWVNPGFLVGPYLPIYGFGLSALYLISASEKYFPEMPYYLQVIIVLILIAAVLTLIEFIAGIIFIHAMKIKLWDYSNEFGNIGGIICPRFSLIWTVLGALYYFLVHPHIISALDWLSSHLAFSFFIGLFFGIFIIDFVYSAQLVVKIRKFATEHDIVIKYEELKRHILQSKEKTKEKAKFILALKSHTPLAEHLRNYYEKQKNITDKLKKKR